MNEGDRPSGANVKSQEAFVLEHPVCPRMPVHVLENFVLSMMALFIVNMRQARTVVLKRLMPNQTKSGTLTNSSH